MPKIYYGKPEYTRDLCGGLEFIHQYHPEIVPSDIEKLQRTHVLLMETTITDPEDIFVAMQGHVWSPYGEARELIRAKGLCHTSMSVGDVVVDDEENIHFVDNFKFVNLSEEKQRLG